MIRQMAGYTILEVMIFLAVSGVLFALVFPTVGNSQDKVKFTQSVQDLQNKINDILNDVSTGYFPNSDATCTIANSTAPPVITPGGSVQGTSQGCVFLGKVLSFSNVAANNPDMNIFTIVGRKDDATGHNINSLTASRPRAVAKSTVAADAGRPDITEIYATKWGMLVNNVVLLNGPGRVDDRQIGAFGAMTALSSTGIGTKSIDIVPVDESLVSLTNPQTVKEIDDNVWDNYNPKEGILVCITDPRTNQRAAILVGGVAGVGKTKSIFDRGNIESLYGVGICG